MSNYKQVVVWRGLLLSESDTPSLDEINNFERYLDKEMNFKVKYITEYKTRADKGDENTGGRNDVLFYIHNDNIPKFAMWRLQTGGEVSWLEDYLDNGGRKLIPASEYNKIKEITNA